MYEANTADEEVKTTNPQESQVVNEKPKKKFKWKKFFGYFFLGILVLGIGYLGYRFYEFKPYRVIVSNVTSRSATISWVTDSAEPGMVVYKEGNTVLPIWISKYGMGNGYDDRDYSNAELEAANKTQENIAESGDISAEDIETEIVVTELGKYWSHHVTIRNLDPETEYEFLVGDGLVFEKVDTVDTEDSMISTLKEIDEIETPIPAYGIVRYYDTEDEIYLRSIDAIVYVILKDNISEIEAKTISSTMNMDGGWYVDLSTAVTSEGENFWDALGDVEVTDVNLNLVIENAGFGRWLKTVPILESSPADTIDLSDDKAEENEEGLEYQGITFFEKEEESSSSLVQKAFARPINYDTPDTVSVIDNHLTIISNFKQSEKYQLEKAKAAEEETLTTADDDSGTSTTTSGSTNLENARGTCGNFDVCEPATGKTVQCGWYNKSSCNCKCANETVGVEWGGTCSCDANGNAVIKERPSTITETAENLIEKTEANRCSNDPVNVTEEQKYTCLSSNGCWYSAGYYSRRTFADTGYTCTKTDDGWRWAGDDVTYVDVTDPTIEKGVCCKSGSSQQWESGVTTCSNLGSEWTKDTSKTSSNSCPTITTITRDGLYFCRYDYYEDYYTVSRVNASSCSNANGYENERASCRYDTYCPEGTFYEKDDPIFNEFICKGEVYDMTSTTVTYDLSWRMSAGASTPSTIRYQAISYEDCKGQKELSLSDAASASQLSWLYNNSIGSKITSFVGCQNDSSISGGHLVLKLDGVFNKCSDGDFVESNYQNYDSGNYSYKPDGGCPRPWETTFFDYVQYECSIGEGTGEFGEADYSWQVAGSTGSEVAIVEKEEEANLNNERTVLKKNLSLAKLADYYIVDSVKAISNKYIYNSEKGIFSGFTPGTYSFVYNGDTYLLEISNEDYLKNGGEFSLFIDLNNDGKINTTAERISSETILLSIENLERNFGYSLREGFNFVSFPFVISENDVKMASELLELLNYKYDNAFYSISKYDSGKWTMVGGNSGTYDQNDFQLIPGQGYVLKTKWDVNITLYGNEVTYEYITDSAPIGLSEGWNLVGLYGTSVKSYTAESILADITNYTEVDFTAVNVSRWVESRALYEALQRDEDSTVYGLDFPIELKKSYFIKVTNGSGNWEPGIDSSKSSSSSSSSSQTTSQITTAELNQGWYWGDEDQKKSGTPNDWILINSGTRSAKWTEPTVSLLETKCIELGGEWIEKFKDCDDISKTICENNNGTYVEYTDACRDNTDEGQVCATMLINTCSFS